MTVVTRQVQRLGFLFLLAGAALVVTARLASAATFAHAEESFVAKINQERAAHGLSGLAVELQLTGVAREWAAVMAQENTLYHNPNLGSQVLGDWTRLGENVGYSMLTGATVDDLVARLHTAFMASPAHRANVLGDYNQVGVGVTVTENNTMWVTANFAKASVTATGAVDEGVRVSQRVFAPAGATGKKADYVVIGRAEVFADSLGGSGLAGTAAPILFTPGPSPVAPNPVLHPRARAELDRILGGKGIVYLLGGTGAVSQRVADELAADGYTVRRLAGASRVETSVAVARETVARRGTGREVLLARADEWADAVTGGAYAAFSGSPVLLTPSHALHPTVQAFLDELKPERRWALGGASALTEQLVANAGAVRVAGADRSGTAVAIAQKLWGRTAAKPGDRFVGSPGWAADGWAYALAFAPWSAHHLGPALLVGDEVPPVVQGYLDSLGYGGDVTGDVETASVVPAGVAQQLQSLVSQ